MDQLSSVQMQSFDMLCKLGFPPSSPDRLRLNGLNGQAGSFTYRVDMSGYAGPEADKMQLRFGFFWDHRQQQASLYEVTAQTAYGSHAWQVGGGKVAPAPADVLHTMNTLRSYDKRLDDMLRRLAKPLVREWKVAGYVADAGEFTTQIASRFKAALHTHPAPDVAQLSEVFRFAVPGTGAGAELQVNSDAGKFRMEPAWLKVYLPDCGIKLYHGVTKDFPGADLVLSVLKIEDPLLRASLGRQLLKKHAFLPRYQSNMVKKELALTRRMKPMVIQLFDQGYFEGPDRFDKQWKCLYDTQNAFAATWNPHRVHKNEFQFLVDMKVDVARNQAGILQLGCKFNTHTATFKLNRLNLYAHKDYSIGISAPPDTTLAELRRQFQFKAQLQDACKQLHKAGYIDDVADMVDVIYNNAVHPVAETNTKAWPHVMKVELNAFRVEAGKPFFACLHMNVQRQQVRLMCVAVKQQEVQLYVFPDHRGDLRFYTSAQQQLERQVAEQKQCDKAAQLLEHRPQQGRGLGPGR